jgi:predicted amidohydrolase YtcJ
MAGAQTSILDAAGGTVLPGFNDAHVHFLHGARNQENLDLSQETTVQGVLRAIAEFAAANPERDWLLGRGWFYAVFPGGMPDRDQLDSAVPDRPIALEAYDSHTTWVNSCALQRLGISESTSVPLRGEIQRGQSGRLTGILKEAAMELVDRALPERSHADDLDSLERAIERAHAVGLTSVQEAGTGPEAFGLYGAYQDSGKPGLRIRLGMRMEPGQSIDGWQRRLAGYEEAASPYKANRWISSGIVKGFADGVIESGTAAMLAPYQGLAPEDAKAYGQPQWDWAELTEAVRVADARGWQVQIHAIGDAAVRAALNAFEAAAERNPSRDRRHRIEHIETAAAEDIPRFRRLSVVASMQPYHADPEPAQLDLYVSKIGLGRASRGWPWGSILRQGGRLAFGSDWPIVSFDPFLGLNSAVNRTTRDGRPEGGWLPGERLSIAEALAGYTTGAAWAEFAEGRKGSLQPGMLADLAVLDRDLMATPVRSVVETQVTATIVGGDLVYRRR